MKSSIMILAASLLATLTQAEKGRSSEHNVTITTKPLAEIPVVDKTVAPENEKRGTLVERDYHLACLIPQQGMEPDVDDCFSACEFLKEYNPMIEVPPSDTVTVNAGICDFTMFNLGCFYHSFSGASVYNACRQMLQHCVYSGFDGLLDDPEGHDIAYSLTGSESAPPYQHPACPGGSS